MVAAPAAAPMPKPRAFAFDPAGLPKHWLNGSAIGTHLANGVNLLFPMGERFFVRSVRHFLDRIEDDPVLKEQVRGFFGQEGRHARAHEDVFEMLQAQGFDLTGFLAVYDRIAFRFIEKLAPPKLHLATTAACEHFTAIMAEDALREDLFSTSHPAMARLLMWHAAEEIEHRAVAFDVLQRVDPSYALRVAGLAMAAPLLAGFWIAGALTLLAQDDVPREQLWRELQAMRGRDVFGGVFGRGIRAYLRRDFHPLENPIDELARDYLAKHFA